ncbi:MAG: hypothetical protein DMF89_05220 [Acidobacteria bacterium]|nr:MAG: hypothetical protein DMF89_05220 [Acidobacteriota bacterium]
MRRVALRTGAVVPPRSDRWHSQPTPTFGGVAIALATIAGMVVVGDWGRPALIVMGASLAMWGIGLVDDAWRLSPLAKLVSSLVVAAFLFFLLRSVPNFGLPAAALTLVAVVWFGGLVHAFNLLDNMDGLAAGIGLVAVAALAMVFSDQLGTGVVGLLAALGGALIGFLIWNHHPSRLFMGDCGSLFVGAAVAGSSLVVMLEQPTINQWTAMPIVLAVPLFDTLFVLVLRRLAGLSATRGGTDHLSHRLVSSGLSEPRAVFTLYGLAVVGAGIGWFLVNARTFAWPLALVFLVGLMLLGIHLARVPAYDGDDFVAFQKAPFAPFLGDLAFKWHTAEVLLDVVLATVCYYTSYRLRFEGESLSIFGPSFGVSLPVVLGCKLVALYASGLYSRMWSTFGLRDLATAVRGVVGGSVLSVLAVAYAYRFERFSRGVFVIDGALLLLAIVATRTSFRWMAQAFATRNVASRRVLIYGAGANGRMIAREMLENPAMGMTPVAFVDDDPAKVGRHLHGVRVYSAEGSLSDLVDRLAVAELLFSTKAVAAGREAHAVAVCEGRGVKVRRLRFEIT